MKPAYTHPRYTPPWMSHQRQLSRQPKISTSVPSCSQPTSGYERSGPARTLTLRIA
jgi:hypothetical protein